MLFRVGVLGCAILLFTCSAESQEARKGPSGDVYGGYSLVAPNFGERALGGPSENGFTVGGDVHFARFFAIAVETDWMNVTYASQLSSSTYTIMAGGRVFYPSVSRARVKLLADLLAGAANFNRMTGMNFPFTANSALAVAADGGLELRLAGPLAMRVEGGYLHSGFQAKYPDTDPQSSIHNEHGRLLVEGVWHF